MPKRNSHREGRLAEYMARKWWISFKNL